MAETSHALALQDILRRDAVRASKQREYLHRVTLGLGIAAAFAEPAAQWAVTIFSLDNGLAPRITSGLLIAVAVCGLFSESFAGLRRDRAMRLHLLSRDAFILALSSYARAISISQADWKTVRDETMEEVNDSRLDEHEAIAIGTNQRKFSPENWWKTTRKPGQGRLAAMLLENSIWSADLFSRAAKAARIRAFRRVFILVVSLAFGFVLSDSHMRLMEASAIVAFLAYIITTDTFDRISAFQYACDRLRDLQRRLKGVDGRLEKGGDLNALTTIYATVVATTPPIPTDIYEKLEQSLQPTDQLLEEELTT